MSTPTAGQIVTLDNEGQTFKAKIIGCTETVDFEVHAGCASCEDVHSANFDGPIPICICCAENTYRRVA